MEARVLNFPDALKLASILYKNFSVEEIGNMTPSMVIYSMVEMSNEADVEFLLSLCKSKSTENIISLELPTILMENEVLSLVEFYAKIGGI